jgi:hypothetical protein
MVGPVRTTRLHSLLGVAVLATAVVAVGPSPSSARVQTNAGEALATPATAPAPSLAPASLPVVDLTGERLVTALGGGDPTGDVTDASVSSDGRWLVFSSDAENLTDDDTNGVRDVFVKDLDTGTVTLLSKLPELGGETDADSYDPVICGDGSVVAFSSDSDLLDLDDNDFNGEADVYVVERDANGSGTYDEFEEPGGVRITRVSVAIEGIEADFGAGSPAISDDCEWVAFVAIDPLSDDDFNDGEDVYVRSLSNLPEEAEDFDAPLLISRSLNSLNPLGGGGLLPSFSADGRFVTFMGSGTNLDLVEGLDAALGGVLLHDRDVSGSGTFDQPGNTSTVHVSVQPNGRASTGTADTSAPAAITPDGRCVAFRFINGFDISDDVVYSSGVFVRDRLAGVTELVSVSSDGLQAIEAAGAAVSPDCRFAGFDSGDPNVVAGDTNGARDAFVHDRLTRETGLLSRSSGTTSASGSSFMSQLLDGQRAIIVSSAPLIGGADGGSGALDAFAVDFTLPATFDLTVSKAGAGSGTVTSSIAGIDCGPDCVETYFETGVVTLTATPAGGSSFAGWSGACVGINPCTVAMTKARSLTATFLPATPGFGDVPSDAFYANGVSWLKLFNITTGFGGDTTVFNPSGQVLRSQMALFMWRMMDRPGGLPPHGFGDMPNDGGELDQAARFLKAAAVTTGFGGNATVFNPDGVVSRFQMALFLHRLAGLQTGAPAHGFGDMPTDGGEVDLAARWLKANGITTGFGGNEAVFAPDIAVDRGQMATFLVRLASAPGAWNPSITLPPSAATG